MGHQPMGWVRFSSNHTWCRWCSPNGPGTWAEVAVAPRYHQEELSGCPILTLLPLCCRSAGTCLTYKQTKNIKHLHIINITQVPTGHRWLISIYTPSISIYTPMWKFNKTVSLSKQWMNDSMLIWYIMWFLGQYHHFLTVQAHTQITE